MENVLPIDVNDYMDRRNGRKRRFEGANIRFFTETILDQKATDAANGIPKYKEVDRLEVHFPGGDKTVREIEPQDKTDYPLQYNAFKEAKEPPIEGTSLMEWAPLPRSGAMELAYFGIRSVEQLSSLPSDLERKIGPLAKWCKPAREWLESANSSQAVVAALRAEVESLRKRHAKQDEQIGLLIARIEANEGTKLSADVFGEKKRGRPRKEESEE